MSKTVTTQSRIRDEFSVFILDGLGEYLAPITRKKLSDYLKGIAPTKKSIHEEYDIPHRYGHSIVIDVKGRVEGYIECIKLNIEMTASKIASLERKLSKARNKAKIHYLKRDIQHRKSNLVEYNRILKEKDYSYTFGTNKLFHEQYSDKYAGQSLSVEERRIGHERWLKDWRLARNYNFNIIGSWDEKYGNSNCQLVPNEDGTFDIYVRLPDGYLTILSEETKNRLVDRKILHIENIKLPKSHFRAIDILRGFNLLKEAVGKQAISIRFHKDHKSWVFSASTDIIPPSMTDSSRGVISVDINYDHLSVVEIDSAGNIIKHFDINLNLNGLSAGSRLNRIRHRVLELVRYARSKGKDIVVESLNFAKKKNELGALSDKRYSKMLSSFAYRKILNAIESASEYRGVRVHSVNPAYTSIIGKFKFMKKYGLSIHRAAALVIGRRYLGMSERLPQSKDDYVLMIGDRLCTLEKPEEDPRHVWECWANLLRQIKKLWAEHSKRRAKDLRKETAIKYYSGKERVLNKAPDAKRSMPTKSAVALGDDSLGERVPWS